MDFESCIRHLLGCDAAHSVISIHDGHSVTARTYSAYGYISTAASIDNAKLSHNGQLLMPSIGAYMLGNGYRAYSPTLRRFLSSDSYSPFGIGGLNSYAAVRGNPVNYKDSSGHAPRSITLAENKVLLNNRRPSIADLQNAFASKANLSEHPILTSNLAERPGRDLQALISKADVSSAKFNIVGSANDLNQINRPQKFIFTNQAELIIGESSKTVDFAHPHLTYFARDEKHVISAGIIMRSENNYILTNSTGHYHQSAKGIDTLAPVLAFLEELQVSAIRLDTSRP